MWCRTVITYGITTGVSFQDVFAVMALISSMTLFNKDRILQEAQAEEDLARTLEEEDRKKRQEEEKLEEQRRQREERERAREG